MRFTVFVEFSSFSIYFEYFMRNRRCMCYSDVEIYMECFLGFLLQEKLRTFKANRIGLINRKCKNPQNPQNPSSKSGAVVSKCLCRIADLGCSSVLFHFSGLLVLWAIHPCASVTRQVFSAPHITWCHVALSPC